MKGFEAAQAAKVEEIAVFGAASETFSQKNINCSIDESLDRFAPVCEAAKARGHARARLCLLRARLPLRGRDRAGEGRRCFATACCDSAATRSRSATRSASARRQRRSAMIEAVAAVVPRERSRCISTTPTARHWPISWRRLEIGIAMVDCSVAGLGGCPYAAGASGNVASEDVLYMLNGLGIETGRRSDRRWPMPGLSSAQRSAARPPRRWRRRWPGRKTA